MSDHIRSVTQSVAGVHSGMKALADGIGTLLVDGFHHLALFAIGATTVWSALEAFLAMVARRHATLSDILLLFIYLEIGAMVGIYFKTTRLPVRYLIYIAITALGRFLIELVSAEHHRRRYPDRHGRHPHALACSARPEIWVIALSIGQAGI